MTRKVRTGVLAGIAALAVAGVSIAAVRDTHTMQIHLPDGSLARIEYSVDISPKVMFAPVRQTVPIGFADGFDGAPFSALDHLAAEMDRQTAAMIRQAAQIQALPVRAPDKFTTAAVSKLPPDTMHYEFVSTSSGSGGCMQSVEMTTYGPNQKPRIVSTSSGDCRTLDQRPEPVRVDTPPRPPIPSPAKPRMAGNGSHSQVGAIVQA